jgi:hypothetical protein
LAGAPTGNQNAANGKKWKAAIDRALAERSRVEGKDMLEALANKLIDQALAGEQWAFAQLGDRLDGKAAQAIEVAGEGGGPVRHSVSVEFKRSATGGV